MRISAVGVQQGMPTYSGDYYFQHQAQVLPSPE